MNNRVVVVSKRISPILSVIAIAPAVAVGVLFVSSNTGCSRPGSDSPSKSSPQRKSGNPAKSSKQFAKTDHYQPSLERDPPVPAPPAAAVRDFNTFLDRLKNASKSSADSLLLHKDALKRAEQVFRKTVGVPGKIRLERHSPFFMVDPEGIFGLYADLPTLERGLSLFQQNCSQCHGPYGRGNGSATQQWYAGNLPRNFSYGKYKSRSTKYGAVPTDRDLLRTLTRGLYGSTMPSFRQLSVQDRWSLVQFLKTLANFYDEFDEVVVNRFDRNEDRVKADALDVAKQPPVTLETVKRGRILFIKQGCVQSHQGRKSKPVGLARWEGAFKWSDEMQRPIQHSRNLTTRVYLSGASTGDLYRIISGGPNIGPMPSYKNLSPADRWALIHYVQSLFKPDYPQAPPSVDALAKPSKTK